MSDFLEFYELFLAPASGPLTVLGVSFAVTLFAKYAAQTYPRWRYVEAVGWLFSWPAFGFAITKIVIALTAPVRVKVDQPHPSAELNRYLEYWLAAAVLIGIAQFIRYCMRGNREREKEAYWEKRLDEEKHASEDSPLGDIQEEERRFEKPRKSLEDELFGDGAGEENRLDRREREMRHDELKRRRERALRRKSYGLTTPELTFESLAQLYQEAQSDDLPNPDSWKHFSEAGEELITIAKLDRELLDEKMEQLSESERRFWQDAAKGVELIDAARRVPTQLRAEPTPQAGPQEETIAVSEEQVNALIEAQQRGASPEELQRIVEEARAATAAEPYELHDLVEEPEEPPKPQRRKRKLTDIDLDDV